MAELGDLNWKKILIFVLIPLALVATPLILCSNPMIDSFQESINENPRTGFNEWRQFAICWICMNTMRYDRAARGYKAFIENFDPDTPGQEENYPFAFFHYAYALESEEKWDEAKEQYEAFQDAYPNHELYDEAVKGIRRIKYLIPNT